MLGHVSNSSPCTLYGVGMNLSKSLLLIHTGYTLVRKLLAEIILHEEYQSI